MQNDQLVICSKGCWLSHSMQELASNHIHLG